MADKATMKQAILNRWENEHDVGSSTMDELADMVIEALETIASDTGERVNPSLVLIGWVKWDGDEFHDFRYTLAGGLPQPPVGYMPVWVKPEDVPGFYPDASDTGGSTHGD